MEQMANGLDFADVREKEGVKSISRHGIFEEDTLLRYLIQKTMWYLILYTQWFACFSSIYSINVVKNMKQSFNNGCRGSFSSPQQASGVFD
jgi:hypothetical protein